MACCDGSWRWVSPFVRQSDLWLWTRCRRHRCSYLPHSARSDWSFVCENKSIITVLSTTNEKNLTLGCPWACRYCCDDCWAWTVVTCGDGIGRSSSPVPSDIPSGQSWSASCSVAKHHRTCEEVRICYRREIFSCDKRDSHFLSKSLKQSLSLFWCLYNRCW